MSCLSTLNGYLELQAQSVYSISILSQDTFSLERIHNTIRESGPTLAKIDRVPFL